MKCTAETMGVSEDEAYKRVFGRSEHDGDEVLCMDTQVVTIRDMMSQYQVLNIPLSEMSEDEIKN